MAVYTDGVRTALGIGRGGRAKVLPWLFIGISITVGLVMALVAGAANRFVGQDAAEALNLPSHSDYYVAASIIMFIFAAVVGPELLCPDRRHGTINLYLVRPLTGIDYLLARSGALLTIMLIAAWLPQVVLFTGLAMGDPEPNVYIGDNWLDVPRFLGSGAAMAAYTSALALVVASFTTRRAYAAAFLIGLFVISASVSAALSEGLHGTQAQWYGLLNLGNVPIHVNDWIFDSTSDPLKFNPVLELPRYVRVGSFFVLTGVAGAVLWVRYRRLSA
jgi:ABC-2 type transport system permease protein